MGTKHVAAAGHYLAAHAGFEILEVGGNAVDAGVAAGIAIGVLEPHMVNFAGVAPIMIYLAKTGEILTISGLGTWPRAASCQYFHDEHGGAIPEGVERTVIPSAPDAWITALEQYGTMSFAEVAAAAIRFAKEGFPVYPLMTEILDAAAPALLKWPSSAEVLLPGGHVPEPGEIFVQSDLARTLQYLVDEESTAAKKGRLAGLRAARDAFYRGDIARTIDRFFQENGGLMTAEDMAGFRVGIEPPVRTQFGNIDVYACGPWCQGPMLLQTLNLVQMFDLHGLGHNSPAYIHTLVEAINLAAADREHYYGDPRFVDVPMEELLSKEHADRRRDLIRPDSTGIEMLPPSDVMNSLKWVGSGALASTADDYEGILDTSYVCVVDREGNAFSATPSDSMRHAPIVPGTGIVPSTRGSQSWTDPEHPSCIAPGKRPRLTPNPAIALSAEGLVMPFGSPGGDVQTQAMMQVLLNIFIFGMDPQSAVEAPRFASASFPSSFEPHGFPPGKLNVERSIGSETGDCLRGLGHRIEWWDDRTWHAGSVCTILADTQKGVMKGAADPRRGACAVGR